MGPIKNMCVYIWSAHTFPNAYWEKKFYLREVVLIRLTKKKRMYKGPWQNQTCVLFCGKELLSSLQYHPLNISDK